MKMQDTRTNPKKVPVVSYENVGYKIFIILMRLLVTNKKKKYKTLVRKINLKRFVKKLSDHILHLLISQ